MNDKSKKRWRGFGCMGAVITVGVFFVWLFFGDSIVNLYHSRPFDEGLWRNWEQVEQDIMWPPRLCMIDDLLSSGKLDGLASNQVVELLGPPHSTNFPFGAVDCDIHYILGPERGLIRIDHEWLFITFGEDGNINRYWLYRD